MFYRGGELAETIDAFFRRYGGYLRKEDLDRFRVEWVEPISTEYRGYEVWELPPNGQGIVALMALNILKGFDFDEKDAVLTYHRQIEALKLAFEDAQRYVTDPKRMQVAVEELLSEGWAAEKKEEDRRKGTGTFPVGSKRGGVQFI